MNEAPLCSIRLQRGAYLEGQYDIYHKGIVIGKAVLHKEGLYYGISCHCAIPGDGMYRIQITYGTKEKDLGICVPEGRELILKKRFPAKDFCSDEPVFQLREHNENKREKFVPVEQDEPFTYIAYLKNARWDTKDTILGVWIAD